MSYRAIHSIIKTSPKKDFAHSNLFPDLILLEKLTIWPAALDIFLSIHFYTFASLSFAKTYIEKYWYSECWVCVTFSIRFILSTDLNPNTMYRRSNGTTDAASSCGTTPCCLVFQLNETDDIMFMYVWCSHQESEQFNLSQSTLGSNVWLDGPRSSLPTLTLYQLKYFHS